MTRMDINVFSALIMLLPYAASILGSGTPPLQPITASDRVTSESSKGGKMRDSAQIFLTMRNDHEFTKEHSSIMDEQHHNLQAQNGERALKVKAPMPPDSFFNLPRTENIKKTVTHNASPSRGYNRAHSKPKMRPPLNLGGGRHAFRNTFVQKTSTSMSDFVDKDSEESYNRFLSHLAGTDYDLSATMDPSLYMSNKDPQQEKYNLFVFPDYIRECSTGGNKAKWVLSFKNFTTNLLVSENDIKQVNILHIKLAVAVRVTKASFYRPEKIFLRVHLRQQSKKLLLTRITRDMLQPVQWMRVELPLTTIKDTLNSLKPPDFIGAFKVTCKRPAGRKCEFVGPVDRRSRPSRKKRKSRMRPTSSMELQYRPYLDISYLTHA